MRLERFRAVLKPVRGAALGAMVIVSPVAAVEVERREDAQTGLTRWQLHEGALSVELAQRLPDQTRAFFLGRGFSAESADAFARSCVFQAIVRNVGPAEGGPVISLDQRRWRVIEQREARGLVPEQQWQQRWREQGLAQAARVAFRWALLPQRQSFGPGDFNWGMVSFGTAPGSEIDLMLVWRENGIERAASLTGVRCPSDREAVRTGR